VANKVVSADADEQRSRRRSARRPTAARHPTLKANLLMAGVVIMLLMISVVSTVGR